MRAGLQVNKGGQKAWQATQKSGGMSYRYKINQNSEWKGTTDFMSDLAMKRTKQLCEEMSVTKELMQGLLLAAGGRGTISYGGGGSDNALTNWDGTKKRNGWGIG